MKIATSALLRLLVVPIALSFGSLAGAAEPGERLSPDQLDDLVAPIALYPDSLLGQVLVASTYPLELVEAGQWLQQHSGEQGRALEDAAREQNWDPSIQALVAFPDVIRQLTSDVRWTTDLGNAFLAQQSDVMDAVQDMRARARDRGRLVSNTQQTVRSEYDDGRNVISIEPANPEVVYVPTYNPVYVWGPPAWGYYPSLVYPAFGFGFGFGSGIYVGDFFGGIGWGGWGWGLNWYHRSVFLNHGFFHTVAFHGFHDEGSWGRGVWTHNPEHRLGVAYPRAVAGHFAHPTSAHGFAASRGFSPREPSFERRGLSPAGRASFGAASAAERHIPASGTAVPRGARAGSDRPAFRSAPSYRSAPRGETYHGSATYRSVRPGGSYHSSPSHVLSVPRASASGASAARGGAYHSGGSSAHASGRSTSASHGSSHSGSHH